MNTDQQVLPQREESCLDVPAEPYFGAVVSVITALTLYFTANIDVLLHHDILAKVPHLVNPGYSQFS